MTRSAIAAITLALALLVPIPHAAGARPSADPNAPAGASLVGEGWTFRVVPLQHGPDAGAILAGTNLGDTAIIYRSGDGGATWTQKSTIDLSGFNLFTCCTVIYELPQAVGSTPAGTLLFASSMSTGGQPHGHSLIPVWQSTDQGATWVRAGDCAEAQNWVGEPAFWITDDGRLACAYSDGADKPDHSQMLSASFSTDGGLTFGDRRVIVADEISIFNPGMITSAKLPDGNWIMAYELCGPLPNCQVYVRRGPDGVHWGDPTDRGTPVKTAAGSVLQHTPVIRWVDNGTKNGTVLLTGTLLNKANGFADDGNGVTVLANDALGWGRWRTIPSPVPVTRHDNEIPCDRWSSDMADMGGGRFIEVATQWDTTSKRCLGYVGIAGIPPAPPRSTTTTTTTAPTTSTTRPLGDTATPATPVPGSANFTG